MIQDIAPKKFFNEFAEHQIEEDDVVLSYDKQSVYLNLSMDGIVFPIYRQVKGIIEKEAFTYLFRIDDIRYFLYEGDTLLPETEDFAYVSWNRYRDFGPMHELLAASVGNQLANWYNTHRFCGQCGNSTEKSKKERALCCSSCGLTIYPTISPSVIVGITHKDQLLLTKYAYGPYKKYALVAGYSEVGESIEETVRREVMEEVGLTIKSMRYYKSQPWPISSAMLFGFFAEIEGDSSVTLQEEELKEGTWFSRETLPETDSDISLTNEMIEYFRNHPEEF